MTPLLHKGLRERSLSLPPKHSPMLRRSRLNAEGRCHVVQCVFFVCVPTVCHLPYITKKQFIVSPVMLLNIEWKIARVAVSQEHFYINCGGELELKMPSIPAWLTVAGVLMVWLESSLVKADGKSVWYGSEGGRAGPGLLNDMTVWLGTRVSVSAACSSCGNVTVLSGLALRDHSRLPDSFIYKICGMLERIWRFCQHS